MEVMLSSATASASASRWIPNISSIRASSTSSFRGISSNNSQPQQKIPISRFPILSSASSPNQGLAAFSVPLAASLAILLWSSAPVEAGILSGSSGLESLPAPQLPKIDFLSRWNDNNQKRYSELDSKFKSSDVLKELLEKTKVNKEKNKRLVQDKYCIRGAEWGVGDCSTQGMTDEERNDFISALKKRSEGD
ncbi:hypothetical protein ZOSMA_55G00290 [Zostera marina]|uniref:Uncharacterized protein n=1 Tax=Zostera marina TaxID=29655 RepID=A0A0K9NWF1_ZOSMR|nr:hypothetical protein ZOSMA_55G00290 [Zostera marina]